TGIVDHRALQSPIKSQGGRGTCSAFATVAGVEALNKRKGQPWGDFSENDAFNGALTLTGGHCTQSGGVHTWATTQVALTGVCPEAAFPYTPQCPAASIPQACQVAPHAKLDHVFMMQTPAHLVPGLPNDAAHRADNVALLESWIHSGADIIYAVDVAGNDWNNGDLNTAVVDVQVDSQGHPAPAYGAHAILMVGYDHNAKYFIFKNSWGTGLGHNGYIYLSYDYVQTYAWYGFVIID
ncbi:MAG: C1 family peptidase, partial [Myxococcales bacterium]